MKLEDLSKDNSVESIDEDVKKKNKSRKNKDHKVYPLNPQMDTGELNSKQSKQKLSNADLLNDSKLTGSHQTP